MSYLIVGGGMTADAAVRGIRAQDPDGPIVLLTEEPHPPYDRPPLSKGLWTGDDESRIWRDTEELGVQIEIGCTVVALDREAQMVEDDSGRRWPYDRLLLATGCRVRRLREGDPGVIYLRTLDDYRTLRRRVEEIQGRRSIVGLIGGGFIGCELAGALSTRDVELHQYFPEKGPLGQVLPSGFIQILAQYLEGRGVILHPETKVTGTGEVDGGWRVRSGDGAASATCHVVAAGLGAEPRVELAERAALAVDQGIVVDAGLRTADPRVFAAGDVARFPSTLTGQLESVAHEEHANESGMLAGQAMAGAQVAYDPVPYFYTGIGDLTLEFVGFPSLSHHGVEEELPRTAESPGLARFHREGRTMGVLIWNRPGRAHRVRRLLLADGEDGGPSLQSLADVVLG